MKVHYLQHVPFEGLGSIEYVLQEKGHEITVTHLYKGLQLPPIKEIDWLIVMGGPMGIYDLKKLRFRGDPWNFGFKYAMLNEWIQW